MVVCEHGLWVLVVVVWFGGWVGGFVADCCWLLAFLVFRFWLWVSFLWVWCFIVSWFVVVRFDARLDVLYSSVLWSLVLPFVCWRWCLLVKCFTVLRFG